MLVEKGRIRQIAPWADASAFTGDIEVIDCTSCTVTPSLADCHTHLLEFAPPAVFSVTRAAHGMGGRALLLTALSAGITALGEQVCGYYKYDLPMDVIRSWVRDIPMDIRFSAASISVGFREMAHYSAATLSRPLEQAQLTDDGILHFLIDHSEYPGENLFLNATPANFAPDFVPKAGTIVYTQRELNRIAGLFHRRGRRIGVHVGGEAAIRMALDAGIDVLHHAHAITPPLIEQTARQQAAVVATPIGGTHLRPNAPEEIMELVLAGVKVAISTDAYLPPHPQADWLPPDAQGRLLGPESLMRIAQPAMQRLADCGLDENHVLALITRNPAEVMGRGDRYGQLREGMEANFVIADGVPGLEITSPEAIRQVYYQGVLVIDKGLPPRT
jgi:imidazolonepropionase-like amidohydrolase